MAKLLEIQDLQTLFYTSAGTVKAVDEISYDVEEGETVAIVGESGCGKSVSALSILRLIANPPGEITGGKINFMGQDLLQLSDREIREIRGRDISMIFQEPMTSLNPVLTIGIQLTEAMEFHLGIDTEEAENRAVQCLEMVGMMIAMALCCEPKLIIADEPTTALDVTIQAQILELMKDLSSRLGVALIVITHNLGVVARYADRVNVMYAGKIIESGTAHDIYHKPSHPYTLGLLHSVPRLDQPRKERLKPIDGQPPDLTKLDNGCSFRPRCSFLIDKCENHYPALEQVASGHITACWEREKLIQEHR